MTDIPHALDIDSRASHRNERMQSTDSDAPQALSSHSRVDHSIASALAPTSNPTSVGSAQFQIGVENVELSLTANVHTSGINGALRRLPLVETRATELLVRVPYVPVWKPHWPKVRTVNITFPEAIEFLPPKAERADGEPEPRRIKPPKPHAEDPSQPKRKPTRLKPPSDALSLEDRLFYVLQPPLESWLAGQELVMPFEPFPFQYEGIAWLFSQGAALLADEMGLGKTMQTITALRLLLRSGHVRRILLVCPKPLIPNWQREFKLWAEELPIVTIEGDGRRRKMQWLMPGIPIRICNYELMVRDFDALDDDEKPKFDLVVLDEAQRIKNRDSRTSEAARSIPRKRSWALTGTPIENRVEEMAAIYEFMEIVPPRGTPDIRQLSKLAKKYVLRRTKDLVMTDLPPRLDRDAYLALTDAQAYTYQVAEKEGVIQLNDMGDSISIQHVFELVLRLKQIANFDPLTGESSKMDRLVADMEEIADSAIRLAEANIVRAIQQVSTERGRDPRDYVLVPFGGAGPLHAARVAEDLNIDTVVVPPNAGVLSASGLLLSDHVHYRARTRRLRVTDATIGDIRATVAELQEEARDYLASLDIEAGADFDRVLEMRYVGQAFEVSVALGDLDLNALGADDLSALFAEAHRRIFEFAKAHGDPVEVVSFRVGAKAPPPQMPTSPALLSKPASPARRARLVERGEVLDAALLARDGLSDAALSGPALIEDGSATIYVPPGWAATLDAEGNVILKRES